ncbi:hypothetical protein D3C76_1539000 [compost metagenome]
MQQAAELGQLLRKALRVVAVTLIAMIVESRGNFGGRIDSGADLLRQLQASRIAKGLGFADQLLAHFEMPG